MFNIFKKKQIERYFIVTYQATNITGTIDIISNSGNFPSREKVIGIIQDHNIDKPFFNPIIINIKELSQDDYRSWIN